MIEVSDAWVEAFNQQLVPETFVEVSLDLRSNYTGTASLTGGSAASFCTNEAWDILNKIPELTEENYATLEFNWWTLDGSVDLLEDTEAKVVDGYVANELGTYQMLYMNLGTTVTDEIPGFTITWDNVHGGYPTLARIRTYLEGELLDEADFKPDSYCSFIPMPTSNFDKVMIYTSGWSKNNRRVRITGFALGTLIVFDKNNLISYSHEQTGDLTCSELTTQSIEFTVDNTDGKWDLLNPVGLTATLSELQKLKVRYGVDINGTTEWIQAGCFYLSEWSVPSDGLVARFTATNLLGFIGSNNLSRTVVKGKVNTGDGSTLRCYPTEALNTYGDEPTEYYLSDGGTYNLYAMGSLYEQSPPSDIDDYATLVYQTSSGGWVDATKISVSTDTTVQALLGKALLPVGIDFGVSYAIGSAAENLTIPLFFQEVPANEFLQLCANRCGYTIWQTPNGTVKFDSPTLKKTSYVIPLDWSYTNPEVELTKPLGNIDVICHYDHTNYTTVERRTFPLNVGETITADNPYTSSDPSGNIATAYERMWSKRTIVRGTFRADPRLELFDIIEIESKYGMITPVVITSIKYTYNGSFHGTYVGRKTYCTL